LTLASSRSIWSSFLSITAVWRFVLGRKAIVAGLWGLVVVLAIATMSWSLGNLSDEITIPDTESATVAKAAYGTFGNDGTSSPLVLVVTLPDGVAVDAAEVRDDWLAVEAVAATGEPATTGEREIRDDCDNRAKFVHTEPVGPNAAGIAYVAAGVNYDAVGGSQYMWVTFAFIGFGVLAFLLAVVGSFFLVRYSLAPVTAIATAAATISEEDLSQRLPVRAGRGDELDRLARTFNDLLARLETAFADREATLDHQRRFVADASHELRTPLTSILGYTRLLQRWGTERPVAHDEALEHLQLEAERMQRLVEDLLLLARGDEASGLVPMPTDLASLLLTMADESMALGDDLSFDPQMIHGDAHNHRFPFNHAADGETTMPRPMCAGKSWIRGKGPFSAIPKGFGSDPFPAFPVRTLFSGEDWSLPVGPLGFPTPIWTHQRSPISPPRSKLVVRGNPQRQSMAFSATLTGSRGCRDRQGTSGSMSAEFT
jgi:HAMP domain-containing protein